VRLYAALFSPAFFPPGKKAAGSRIAHLKLLVPTPPKRAGFRNFIDTRMSGFMPDGFGAAFLRSKKDAGSRIRTCEGTKPIDGSRSASSALASALNGLSLDV